MKDIVKIAARAFHEIAETLPPEEYPTLSDAVISLLIHHRCRKNDLRRFRMLVERTADRQKSTLLLTLSSPSGALGAETKHIVSALEHRTGRHVELLEKKDPSLHGGIKISFDDERIDATLHGKLAQLAAFMCNPLSVSL